MNLTDALNSVTPHQAGVVAMSALDRLQGFSPADQLAGAALLVAAICQRTGEDVRELLVQAERRLADAARFDHNAKPGETCRALHAYIEGELV